jgi:hypothetical protein
LPSPPSYLVLVLGATTALTFLIWLVNHEQALVRTACGLAAAAAVFALANVAYLYVATLTSPATSRASTPFRSSVPC